MMLSIPERVHDDLCRAVGYVIVNWAFVDNTLSMWAAEVYHSAGGKHKEAEIPRNFGRKIRSCGAAFGKSPSWHHSALTA
jgi:hypothetical protein